MSVRPTTSTLIMMVIIPCFFGSLGLGSYMLYVATSINMCPPTNCTIEAIDGHWSVVIDAEDITHRCYDLNSRYSDIAVNMTLPCYTSSAEDCPFDGCISRERAIGVGASLLVLSAGLAICIAVPIVRLVRRRRYSAI